MKTLRKTMVRMALMLAAAAACLGAYPSSAQAQQPNITGVWDSSVGDWNLTQAGSAIWGTLNGPLGAVKVRGSIDGRVVRLSFWGVVDSGTAWLYVKRTNEDEMVGRYRTTVGKRSGRLTLTRQ
ncbi:MAG: hypothetical protein H8E44_13065 [Planctomycetes bacterium]|nr:hypothetical protein [Planctomycetota bacterium]MBL7037762.1 hypothetical protein [Pirellulaceae bacterium]